MVVFSRLNLHSGLEGTCSRLSPIAAGILYLVYTNTLPVNPGITLYLLANKAMFFYTLVFPAAGERNDAMPVGHSSGLDADVAYSVQCRQSRSDLIYI